MPIRVVSPVWGLYSPWRGERREEAKTGYHRLLGEIQSDHQARDSASSS